MRRYSKILSKVRSWLLAVFLLLASLYACTHTGNNGSDTVIVRVYDEYLYVSDLADLVPPGTSIRDSLTMVRTFVQNWVDKTLLVKKAEENLPDDLQDLSKQIEEYRNSLIIFEYEKMLVKQELDTVITSADIKNYYMAHKSNFVLKDDILNMRYLILHTDSPAIRKFRTYMQSQEPADMDSLALYSSKYAEFFDRMIDRWIDLEEMADIVPVNEYSFRDYFANRRFLEMRDSAFVYMVYVNDYKPTDSIPPSSFVEKEIRNIILNQRKNELIKKMLQGVLLDATEHNQLEIY